MKHYFAEYGDYGSAENMLLVETDNWTNEDWELLQDCTDSVRLAVAKRIAEARGGAE